jgi:hypothetical protein
MSITIQLDLPDDLLNEAKAKGLLESARMAVMLSEELRRERASTTLGETLKQLHALPGEPMSYEDIQTEVDAVRAERRRSASSH